MRWQDHIVPTADTLHGWPRFRNTRIPVAVVLDNLAAGVTAEELHADYPTPSQRGDSGGARVRR
jgi:uncharacterized protein (DUF433 family)